MIGRDGQAGRRAAGPVVRLGLEPDRDQRAQPRPSGSASDQGRRGRLDTADRVARGLDVGERSSSSPPAAAQDRDGRRAHAVRLLGQPRRRDHDRLRPRDRTPPAAAGTLRLHSIGSPTVAAGPRPTRLATDISDRARRPGLRVRTRAELTSEAQQQINQSLGFISAFLLVFAGIALLVGSFLVLNTFSVLVAQRARDLAMLRAIGATRRQVACSVLGEALLVGLLGGTVGLGLGLLLALGHPEGVRAHRDGHALRRSHRSWTAVVASYGVAVVVTRARRVAPGAARLAHQAGGRPARRHASARSRCGRAPSSARSCSRSGWWPVVGALRTPSSLPLVALGAAIVLAAGVMLSPWLVSQALAVGGLGPAVTPPPRGWPSRTAGATRAAPRPPRRR